LNKELITYITQQEIKSYVLHAVKVFALRLFPCHIRKESHRIERIKHWTKQLKKHCTIR